MPEHEIRFRAGWILDEAGETARQMIALPVNWSNVPTRGRLVRILRSFQRPPIDPDTESIALRIGGAPGLVALRLNNRPIPLGANGFRDIFECELEPLAERRNALELEVDRVEASTTKTWGNVSLVIRREI